MATQTLPHVLQFPQSIPAKIPEQVTQFEIAALLSLRNRARQLQEQIDLAEESVKLRLTTGAIVEPGDHTAELKETDRRNVSWKAVVIRLASRLKMDGEAYCDRVLAATRPTTTVSLELR